MITLIKALWKLYTQLLMEESFSIKIFTLILTRCCIILCITTMKLNLKESYST